MLIMRVALPTWQKDGVAMEFTLTTPGKHLLTFHSIQETGTALMLQRLAAPVEKRALIFMILIQHYCRLFVQRVLVIRLRRQLATRQQSPDARPKTAAAPALRFHRRLAWGMQMPRNVVRYVPSESTCL